MGMPASSFRMTRRMSTRGSKSEGLRVVVARDRVEVVAWSDMVRGTVERAWRGKSAHCVGMGWVVGSWMEVSESPERNWRVKAWPREDVSARGGIASRG